MLRGVICLGACAVLAIRVWLAGQLPLWLDETWSAMIATQPDWASFWREAWLDCNPPLYYVLLSAWVVLFGDANLALRLPSVVFVAAAALAPLAWRPRGLNPIAAWTWAALIVLWGPGIYVTIDARGYGLLLLLSTLSCLLVMQLLERPALRTAGAWVAIGTMMFLTHYFSAVFLAAQALVLVRRHGLALLRLWPAGAPAIPGLLWFAWHYPRLREYARPDVVWYKTTTLADAYGHVAYAAGGGKAVAFVPMVLAILLAGLLVRRRRDGRDAPLDEGPSPSAWPVALAGWIGIALALVMGSVQPSLTDRYFVPMVPPVLLTFALLAQRSGRQTLVSLLLVIVFLVPGLQVDRLWRAAQARYLFGYEHASAFVAARRPTNVVFLWDHPAAKILDRGSLAGIGGYFLKRDGLDVATTALVVDEADDANARLRAAATGERPAVIWLYNTARRSAARFHPPVLGNDPGWECRHYRRPTEDAFELGAIACVKKEPGHA